ncbi:MAG TPA: ROK family protein [Roseiflexaceae bacterium]|nr:ROK family protein [Roseiflexaceae bacterium]
MEILGIDIGGSGVKGAPVDTASGDMLAERHRIRTPQPATPDAVGDVVDELARFFNWQGLIGCTLPSVIKNGVAFSAANIDKAWVGTDAAQLLTGKTGCPTTMINDADAAGLAEMRFGAGRDRKGVVMMLTFGTGIGSALFLDGRLVPNTEFGHMEVRGKDGEHRASDRVREEKALSWAKWAARVNEYLGRIELLFSPDLLIIGGGVSKKHAKFMPLLRTRAEIVIAQLLNDAGLIGAALAADK